MAGIHITHNLSQSQVLSPQMRQSLEVLQANSLELGQILQQALATNPVLEIDSNEERLEEVPAADAERDMETLSELDDDFRELQITERRTASTCHDDEAKREFLYNSIVASETLQQHLLSQLSLSAAPAKVKQVASVLIGHINDRGFIDSPIDEICRANNFTPREAERARATLQHFDPAGVAALDLTESLQIQLARVGRINSLEYKIVSDFLPDLARKRLPEIAKSLGVSLPAVTAAAEAIACLTPDPGAKFDPTSNPHISPDIIILKDSVGQWEVKLTNDNMPDISISNAYKSLMASTDDNVARQYLRNQIRDGKILIRSVSQRQETLYKLAQQIILRQPGFLEHGLKELKPMRMNDIAESVEVHPATISRAVAGKFILTPHGLMELRTFFTSGYTTDSGGEVSNTSVKENIQKIIAGEDSEKPLSDSAIEKILKQQGVKVARRTISKYRDQLNILPSHLRKQFTGS